MEENKTEVNVENKNDKCCEGKCCGCKMCAKYPALKIIILVVLLALVFFLGTLVSGKNCKCNRMGPRTEQMPMNGEFGPNNGAPMGEQMPNPDTDTAPSTIE